MKHTGKVVSGDKLGNLVHWVECECGWIGYAAATDYEAWHSHVEHAKKPR